MAGSDAWLRRSGLGCWRRRQGQEFIFERDRPGDRTGLQLDDGGEGIAGFTDDFEYLEAFGFLISLHHDALVGLFLVEQGDAVATRHRRDADKGVILKGIGDFTGRRRRRLGGEGRIRPETRVLGDRRLSG